MLPQSDSHVPNLLIVDSKSRHVRTSTKLLQTRNRLKTQSMPWMLRYPHFRRQEMILFVLWALVDMEKYLSTRRWSNRRALFYPVLSPQLCMWTSYPIQHVSRPQRQFWIAERSLGESGYSSLRIRSLYNILVGCPDGVYELI